MASLDLSANNFGLIIAYFIPGYTAIRGLPLIIDQQNTWALTSLESTVPNLVVISGEALLAGLTGQHRSMAHRRFILS